MANTYLIKDSFFKEQYPMYNNLDMSKFYSTLLVEQQTTIEEWIGSILYKWLLTAAATELVGNELKFLNTIQYALVFLTAYSLIRLSNTPKEQSGLSVDALSEKITYIKSKIINQISEFSELQAVISLDGGNTIDDLPDINKFESPIYFWR